MPTEDTPAIVAAILAAVRIMKHGIPGGANTEATYEAEYRRMLDEVQKNDPPTVPGVA